MKNQADNRKNNIKRSLESHNIMMNFFQVGDFFQLTHYFPTNSIENISPSVFQILGFELEKLTLESFTALFHPDDFINYIDCENTATFFLLQLPPEKIHKYKISHDFRIQKSDGNYLRFLQQTMAVETTDNGGIIRTMVVYTDITHLKTSNKSSLSFIGIDGEPSYIDVPILKNEFYETQNILTKREREILNYLINGYSSKQIAEALFISEFTVGTHRKKILSKTGCTSTPELIVKAVDKGWV